MAYNSESNDSVAKINLLLIQMLPFFGLTEKIQYFKLVNFKNETNVIIITNQYYRIMGGVLQRFVQNYYNTIRFNLDWDTLVNRSWSSLTRGNRREAIRYIGRENLNQQFLDALQRNGYSLD